MLFTWEALNECFVGLDFVSLSFLLLLTIYGVMLEPVVPAELQIKAHVL